MGDNFNVYLRGIDISETAKKYRDNNYLRIVTPLPLDSTLLNNSPLNIVTVNNKSQFVNYTLEITRGLSFACIGYKVYDKSGRYAVLDPNKVYNCMNCLRQIKWYPIGIPIKCTKQNGKSYYHMIDIFCTFNCCYNELLLRLGNSLYSQSVGLLKELFKSSTGKDENELRTASDKRYLRVYNGVMEWDEYHESTISYSPKSSNAIFVPVIEYIEQDYVD